MLENDLLDGDDLVAYKKALSSKQRENALFFVCIVIGIVLYYLDIIRGTSLLVGVVVGSSSFLYTVMNSSIVYYYTWEDSLLTLLAMNRFGKKNNFSFPKDTIKKISNYHFLLSKENQITLEFYTSKRTQKFFLINEISRNEIDGFIKEIMNDKK